jgi:hypothetical protein
MKFVTRSLYVTLILLISAFNSNAQKTELGFLAGGSYYYGDIVNNTIQLKTIGPGFGVFMRYHINKKTSIRGNLMYCRVQGADSNLVRTNVTQWQRDRNLAFYSDVIEVSGMIEYNLIPDLNKGRKMYTRFVPYVLGGIGLFYFDPKAIHPITGKPISLRPLRTDGTSYLPIAIALPIGVGVRYYLSKNWQIGFELGTRLTSTSRLDDVVGDAKYPNLESLPSDDARIMSIRNQNSVDKETQITTIMEGKPRGKIDYITDIYMIYGITVSYRIWPKGPRAYCGKAVRCPRFY